MRFNILSLLQLNELIEDKTQHQILLPRRPGSISGPDVIEGSNVIFAVIISGAGKR